MGKEKVSELLLGLCRTKKEMRCESFTDTVLPACAAAAIRQNWPRGSKNVVCDRKGKGKD
jgi:hypothetical protein